MKFFPINHRYNNSKLNYWSYLDSKVDGLIRYVDTFNANWKVLNEAPCIYTMEELVSLGYVKPAIIEKGESTSRSLIVVTSTLQYGEGLINNFSGYDSVWLYYGNPADLNAWYSTSKGCYVIPQSAIPNTNQTSTSQVVELYLSDYLAFSDKNTTNIELSFDGTSKIQSTQLMLTTTLPLRETFAFSSSTPETSNGTLHELPSSYYIFSVFSDEVGLSLNSSNNLSLLDKTEYKEKKNFLLARTSRGGGYYTWTYGWNPGKGSEGGYNEASLVFQAQASDITGLKYLLDADFRQKRYFISNNTWEAKVNEKIYLSFAYDSSSDIIPQIKTTTGSFWSGNHLVSHEFYSMDVTETGKTVETFFMNESRTVGVRSINKTSTPSYTIKMENQLGFSTDVEIW